MGFREEIARKYSQEPNSTLKDGQEFYDTDDVTVRVVFSEDGMTFGERYLGTQFGSTVDYGERYNKLNEDYEYTEQDLAEEIRNDRLNWVQTSAFITEKVDRENDVYNVVDGVVVVVKDNGYSIHPDPETEQKVRV